MELKKTSFVREVVQFDCRRLILNSSELLNDVCSYNQSKYSIRLY